MNPLKIIKLEASNVKVLKAITITPDGNVVTLAGPNGSGKSSCLDAIWYALGGKDVICEQPIRRGASTAEIRLKLGDTEPRLIVTRKMTATGVSLQIKNAEGVVQQSPQTILDDLVGNLAFDPLAFSRMRAAEQRETLRKLAGLDFSKHDQERAQLYAERTLINREIESAKARLNAARHWPEAPKEEVSIEGLAEELARAEETNRLNQEKRGEANTAKRDVAMADSAIESAQRAVAEAEEVLRKAREWLADREKRAADLRAVADRKAEMVAVLQDVDTAAIRTQLSAATTTNKQVADNLARSTLKAEVDQKLKRATALSEKIEALDKAKSAKLSAAKFPLPGLGITEDGATLNDLPFSQASTAEQIRASVAIAIALNSKLKVIFVRDGSLLDDKTLGIVAEMAEAHGCQVWIETVRSDDPSAVRIEEGEIVSCPPESQPEPEPATEVSAA